MDADEALARQLQAEEDAAAQRTAAAAAARSHLRGSGQGQARLSQLVQDALNKAQSYEDELAQAMALSVMPHERLVAAAEEAVAVSRAMGEQPPLAREDGALRGLGVRCACVRAAQG